MTLLFYIKRGKESIVTSQLVSGLEGLSQVHISCHAFPEFTQIFVLYQSGSSAQLMRWFRVPMMKGHRMEKVAQSAPWSGSIGDCAHETRL